MIFVSKQIPQGDPSAPTPLSLKGGLAGPELEPVDLL
jgi:hypothetical protein